MREPEGIARILAGAETVAICSHVNPDGDTIGSALAMRLILEYLGKKADCFCQDKVPENLRFLPGVNSIRHPENAAERYDLLLSVDASDTARLGSCWEILRERCDHIAQIDHHGTNPLFAEVNSVDEDAAATCVMIREQMKYLRVPLTGDIAQCLYAGISTDTGNFTFSCTNAEVFQVMADIMEAGLPLSRLSEKLFRERSRAQLKLLGRAIESIRFTGKDQDIAVMNLTRKDFEDCGALSEHADTIVNYALETTGTLMALLARENDDGRIKCSLRAEPPYLVDGVANRLGGGGHSQASGISMEGTLKDCTDRVLEEMRRELEELKKNPAAGGAKREA